MSALMDGAAPHGVPTSDLFAHGDYGLGTFLHMVSEMIVLDGAVYQMEADGSIVPITSPSTTITPFCTVTRFRPTTCLRAAVSGKQGLAALLHRVAPPAKNNFMSVRMDGVFWSVRVRTAGGQVEPGEKAAGCCRETDGACV
jgi:alpha-acetolactate decarboxylase